MYEVSANINDVEIRKVNLLPEIFQLNVDEILRKAIQTQEGQKGSTKLIFVCCPNNPTGNSMKWEDIRQILENFNGLVVVDEAYINYAPYRSIIPELLNYPNLVVLQTLSKAWGLAGLRLGMAFASQQIIDLFNKVKPPYNVNIATQELAFEALSHLDQINDWIRKCVHERNKLATELKRLTFVQKVYPSAANFLLVKMNSAEDVYQHLVNSKVIVRDRSRVELCESCLRMSIGTEEENQKLFSALQKFENHFQA
jgi:histidinol-phosphate aminotransferase